MENKEKDMKQLLSDEELKNVNGGIEDPMDPDTWNWPEEGNVDPYHEGYCAQYNGPSPDPEGCNANKFCKWYGAVGGVCYYSYNRPF